MAMHELGPTIDLHGGGTDLIFPHHECEVAQSESITGEPFSRHWVHSAMVSYEGEKMSKSLGNLVFVSDLLKTADPRAIRLALMRHHYRAGFEWHDTDLDEGTALLHRLRRRRRARPTVPTRVRSPSACAPRIDDDLDAPRALEALDDLASAVLSGGDDATAPAVLRELGALLGIDLDRPLNARATRAKRRRRPVGGHWYRRRPMTITITLPDGSTREHDAGRHRGRDRGVDRRGPGQGRARRPTVDGEWYDLDRPIDHDATRRDRHPRLRRRPRGAAPLDRARDGPGRDRPVPRARSTPSAPRSPTASTTTSSCPAAQHFTDDDLERIEARMREIVKADEPFVREELDREHAIATFADQPYKIEIIERVDPDDSRRDRRGQRDLGVPQPARRRLGAFVDLCRGPHVPSTKRLGAFKLTKVAGAYWRGDEKRPMLQRIYGTAWESKAALEEHLHRLEEAEKRDHRKLGAELDLFSFPEEIGSGLAVFHPKGGTIRRVMEDYSRQRHEEAGYEFVNSPHITKSNLFEISGHLDWFADGMYPPMELDGGTDYYLKPMNCPFHILIYRSRMRSYRELPLRLFEFGTVYRYEKSGVVHGLTRVRGMTQDDAHIFCTTRADRPRARVARSSSCSACCATTASTTSTSSCRPSPRARRSAPTRSGRRRPRRCARSAPRPTTSSW